ncbi:MAG: SCP2 sterol-binding domain-containing protein [Actinobacteria bacterium]|nr:SCP2 sterol-binding domain-containing protein [Actinomycetota bacterium]
MVAYLSDEWFEVAGQALANSTELAERTAEVDLAIAYEVSGAPGGKVVYTLRFDHGTTTLANGVSDAPVSFSLDYDTASEIARGDVAAQAAFMQGRLKLVGDVNVLIRDGAVLDGVADALGSLRTDTEF